MTAFGTYNGKQVDCIRLHNGKLSCEILSYGATLRSLRVPDLSGKPVDVVLGFDTLEDYAKQDSYIGATVGPNANRIGGAALPLGKRQLKLDRNEGENNLHSGFEGFDRQIWEILAASEEAVTLICTHPNGRGGFPGDLNAAVTYWLEGNALLIDYYAISQRDTICNLTNHSYFNLDGHDSGSIENHRVQLFAKSFTPIDAQSIPTGAIRAVSGSAMDLTKPVCLSDRMDGAEEQLRLAKGFDHNYVIDAGVEPFRAAAKVWGAKLGIVMTVYTDRPGVQFYTGNFLPEGLRGKDGAVYHRRQGLCLETQAFPDAPNHSSFPPTVLRAEKEWQSRTVYQFSLE